MKLNMSSGGGAWIRISAFTLAEVLISLGIIGVVAALTLPNVINKFDEIQTVSKLKKVYSVLSQGYIMYMEETGEPFKYEVTAESSAQAPEYVQMYEIMRKQYVKVTECKSRSVKCWPKGYYKTLTGKDYIYGYGTAAGKGTRAFLTPDGMSISFGYDTIWGQDLIIVDINGFVAPNRGGYDVFAFAFSKDKIVPLSRSFCNPTAENDSDWNRMNGWGCTKWVLQQGNTDYKKCLKGNKKYCSIKYNI